MIMNILNGFILCRIDKCCVVERPAIYLLQDFENLFGHILIDVAIDSTNRTNKESYYKLYENKRDANSKIDRLINL